jgi:hypothetical protein
VSGLNPNFVLVAIVVVTLSALAAVLFLVGRGGSTSELTLEVGLITAISVPVVTSLFALFNSALTRNSVNGLNDSVNSQSDELEAAQARIAYLEGQAKPPISPPLKPPS